MLTVTLHPCLACESSRAMELTACSLVAALIHATEDGTVQCSLLQQATDGARVGESTRACG